MERFIDAENVSRFLKLLCEKTDETSQRTLRSLLARSQRRLALIDSATTGLYPVPPVVLPGRLGGPPRRSVRRLQHDFEASPKPYLLIDPNPGLHIVDINDAYARATMTERRAVAGAPLFDVFPDNPEDPSADGVSNLYESLRIAAATGHAHAMPIQRYDVRDAGGHFVERYWRPSNTPIRGEDGELIYLLHHAVDVTAEVWSRSASENDAAQIYRYREPLSAAGSPA